MEIKAEAQITYPRELAFETLRDRLDEVAEYMEHVEKVELGSRAEPEPGVVTFVNTWYGVGDDIPTVARPFIKPEMIKWTDYARWIESEFATEWRMETAFMTDRVHCAGRNHYEDNGDRTCKLVIGGDLTVDPPLIAKAAKGAIESYVVGLIEPNLAQTADALQHFLDDHPEL